MSLCKPQETSQSSIVPFWFLSNKLKRVSTVEDWTESTSCTAAVRFCTNVQGCRCKLRVLKKANIRAGKCRTNCTFSSRVGPSVLNTSFHKATATMNKAAPRVTGPRYLCHEGLQHTVSSAKLIWHCGTSSYEPTQP